MLTKKSMIKLLALIITLTTIRFVVGCNKQPAADTQDIFVHLEENSNLSNRKKIFKKVLTNGFVYGIIYIENKKRGI